MDNDMNADKSRSDNPTINVRVITTSGNYPEHGHAKVPLSDPLQLILTEAAKALEIVNTTRWVVKVDGKEVPASSTYVQLGLHGEVKLDWGVVEGGGG